MMNDDQSSRKFIIKLAWGQAVFFLVLALVATFILGLSTELIIGWIALVLLIIIGLLAAYGVHKLYLSLGAILVAAILLAAFFLHQETWAVKSSRLLEWSIAAAAFAVWILAFDKRTQAIYPFLAHLAGLITLLSLLAYAAIALIYGLAPVTGTKGLLSLAIIFAFYKMAGQQWKIPLSIAALIAMGILIARAAKEVP
ncbi:MAG: hypothetical protein EG826_17195 [Deltaproteobacteria bacterium]|nr:hypothetical protein [Deltaproteobacteria bacterium]